jgi:adenosylhomocysteine nucleosidase
MLTGDQFIADPVQAQALALAHQGLTVDWETAAVAFVAERSKVPWVSIRVVSDSADSRASTDFERNLPPVAQTLAEIIKGINRLIQTEG